MTDARTLLDDAPMRPAQFVAIAVTIGLNALDGFDVLSISFASPLIARDWSIDRAALGAVLSMELIGMALGSLLLGGVADRHGRRPTIIGCLLVMTAGMAGATTAGDIAALSGWRLLTGLGIGGMLAAINAMAAELSNARWRTLALSLMVIGYPLGAVIGGSVAVMLLADNDWRPVFQFGAIVTALFVPLVALTLPESPAFLAMRRPGDALVRINASLHRLGHPLLAALPALVEAAPRARLRDLMAPGLRATTLLVTAAYCAHIITFYFTLKWIPKIVVDMGYAAAAAGGVLVWANVGGATGGAIFGLLARRLGLRRLTIFVLIASAALVVIFGQGQSDLTRLSTIAAAVGFFTNAGVAGLYALFAQVFPTSVRATGTGFAVGVGRGGAAAAPWLAGLLFETGLGLQGVAVIMAAGSAIGAVALLRLKYPIPQ